MSRALVTPSFLEKRENQYGQWWDFTQKPDRLTASVNVTAGANAGDDTAATPFFMTGARAILVTDGFAQASVNSAGIDANNTSAWVVASLAGTAILTKTHSANTTLATSYNMGAPSASYLAANTGMTFAITNGTTADLNSSVVTATVGYIDADSFMTGLKVIATDGGTVTVSDGVKGAVALAASDGTAGDNDEIYLATDTEIIKFAAGKSYMMEALIQFSEANTDDANVFFGSANAFAADMLVDDAGGPKATGDYVGMWKVDGGTKWYCGAQSNGTATPSVDALGVPNTTAGGSSYQKLTIEVLCLTSTRAKATFRVDGTTIGDVDFVYSSATEQQMGLGIKNGSANKETLTVDYMGYEQIR
ncbi:MAG: hypothetical protein WC655_25015 [Candidatus Hydrogenedentales bacterium]|jgi:hypothetical protein